MAVISRASYKLEFRCWSGGVYSWTDYTTRLLTFGEISMQSEGLLRNSFKASIGDIIVDNSDSFWTLQTDTLLFAGSDPYGTKFRKRRFRISVDVPDVSGALTNYIMFTGIVDNLVIGMDGKATIKTMSLDRNAQEQKLDTDKINNTTIGGAWGTGKVYESRTLNGDNENYSYSWFKDRKYPDMLKRVSEALDDSAYEHESIAVATGDGRRVCSTLPGWTNVRPDSNVPSVLFWSQTHGCLLLFSGTTPWKLYSWNPATETFTERIDFTALGPSISIASVWENTVSGKVFFILNAIPSATAHSLYQLNADYTTTIKNLKTDVDANIGVLDRVQAAYSQSRNGGNGSIFLAAYSSGSYVYIYEYECSDISSSFTQLNKSANLRNCIGTFSAVLALGTDNTNRLFFIGATTAYSWNSSELYWFDIATGWAAANVYKRTNGGTGDCSLLDLHVDSDRVFVIYYISTSTFYNGYKLHVRLDTDADGAAYSTALWDTGTTDAKRVLSPFISGGDGLYLFEYSVGVGTDGAAPTYILCVKDADKTTCVMENKISAAATYGDHAVDAEVGLALLFPGLPVANVATCRKLDAAYKPGTDWILYACTGSPNYVLFQFATTLSEYSRIWPMRGLSAWDLRVKTAEKYNAVVFYDYDGTFRFKKRPTSGAAAYTLTSFTIKSLSNGMDKVVNVVKGVPYTLPFSQAAPLEITPIVIRHPSSTCTLKKITLSVGNTSQLHVRVKMTSTTAFTLDYESAPGTWINLTTGTIGTTLIYDSGGGFQITIAGGDWTGSAYTGDTFMFWTYITEQDYVACGNIEKIEALDATSIAAYQRTEQSFDNKFCIKTQLPDIINNLLAYWATPHRILPVSIPLDLNYKLLTLVNLTDTYLGITTATVWAITKVVIKMGEPLMDIELTEIV